MEIHKKVLTAFLCIFILPIIFLLGSCNTKVVSEDKMMEINFPLNEAEYPQNNVVVVNNKSYPLEIVGNSHIDAKVDSEIKITMNEEDDIVEVILPQYLPINNWSIEEKEYIHLISYDRIDFPIKDKNMIEGISSVVQKFQFQISRGENTEILLKWSNINEVDKLFKDKKEDYLLRIVVSY